MLNKLTNRVYYMPYRDEGCRPSLGLVIGDKYSLVVDAGNSIEHTNEFLEEIKSINHTPIKYLAITHWHWDHVAGISIIDVDTICHKRTNEKIEEVKNILSGGTPKLKDAKILGRELYSTSTKLKVQMNKGLEIRGGNIEFTEKVKVDLGGISCIIENIEGDHADDSSLIYVTDEKVMFLGDSTYRNLNTDERSYSREKLYPLIEKILSYDTEYYLTAHKPYYTKESMKEYFDMLTFIGDTIGDSLDLERALSTYKKKVNREIDSEERMYVESFVNGNKKLK
ncbi:MBL fold metallo-hydrolase [Clostridium cylindrosporum]|uniref:Putative metallo-beta-lactamase n=1 Tax=Clostridium cylindrosporum DSM 605 TaxID=1121307 RepID=A0A0J8DBZ0_CLOCY|nr:MBL fold metallo-hydrolase [Clostridium cylindrosporum]KMT21798.1 putative metallo-beta-lactamase [Clostridium cylindrosporum DSM 605]